MDRVKSDLHNFVKDKKKGLIIGTAVAVVGLGLGAGFLFNHGNSGGTESNGAAKDPAVISRQENKSVVREDVSISTLSNFRVLSPVDTPKAFGDASNIGEDVKEGGYITEGEDGAKLISMNSAEDNNTSPVCGLVVRTHKADDPSSIGEIWSGDTVEQIAENSQATRIITYPEKSTNPIIAEKVEDLKVKSYDGTKNYLFPAMKYSSPNGGLVKYFAASKIGNGDYIAVIDAYCFDQHASEGFAGAEKLPDNAFADVWSALDNLRIKPE